MSDSEELESPFLDQEVLSSTPQRRADAALLGIARQSPFAYEDRRAPSGGTSAVLAPLGRGDDWPDIVYVAKGSRDSFLNSAREFHRSWKIKIVEFDSIEGLIGSIAKSGAPANRIRVVSHAADEFMIPLFKGSPAGFGLSQKQIEAANENDAALMDELLGKVIDLDHLTSGNKVLWNDLLKRLESGGSGALKPFGYTATSKPSGWRDVLLRRCVDLDAIPSKHGLLLKAARMSLDRAVSKLGRSAAEGSALISAVRSIGFPVKMTPTADMIARVAAAFSALDRRDFRKLQKQAQSKLKDKVVDFRGCRIGHKTGYLKAFATLMGSAACTAPDWWSGYPGETPADHKQVKSVAAFEAIVNASAAAAAAMNKWGTREVSGWSSVPIADRPARFFNAYLVAASGILPVHEVDYSGASVVEKYTLVWNNRKAKERWLASMWSPSQPKRAQELARLWGDKTPGMPALSLHLKRRSSSAANPQKMFVTPEPEFMNHIKEGKP